MKARKSLRAIHFFCFILLCTLLARASQLIFEALQPGRPDGTIPLQYPQLDNPTNYLWWLDASTDAINWQIYAGPFCGVGTNVLTITNTGGPRMLFRMRGIEIYHYLERTNTPPAPKD